MHDILTGSDKDGRAFPPNMDLTCANWTSSGSGVAMLGHADREGNPPVEGSQNVQPTWKPRIPGMLPTLPAAAPSQI
jgi:hypothetical protein